MENDNIIPALRSYIEAGNKNTEIEENKNFNGIKTDLFIFRKGKNFVFPQRDYFFIYNIGSEEISKNAVSEKHEAARNFVNAIYKMPKALRFSVPNICSVFIGSNGFSEDVINLAEYNTRSVIGGEIHTIYLIDLMNKVFYGQGINRVPFVVDGVRTGLKLEFKKIDPQNRAFYFVQELAKVIIK